MKLGDLCELIVDCEHKTAPTQAEGYPSIRTPNIGRGYFLLDGVNRVSEETYRLWTRRAVPQPGDLIMAREAPVGNVAMVPHGLQPCLGQRTLLIRPDKVKADPRYLAYLIVGDEIQGAIHGMTNGATVPHLNMKDVRALSLPPIPALPVQQKIASILSAYDDLLENNRRRIQVLERMAQALYREWFVSFRFPGHAQVKLVTSPMGKIPQGWKVQRLDEMATVNASTIRRGVEPENIAYVDIASVSTGRIEKVEPLAFNDAPSRARRIVRHGDTIWSCVRPNRKSFSLILNPISNLIVSTGFAVLTPTKVPFSFFYQAVTTDDFVSYLTNNATGAAYPAVTAKDFEAAKIVLPNEPLMRLFNEHCEPLLVLKENLIRKHTILRRARDLLLPKLISGTLDVSKLDIEATD